MDGVRIRGDAGCTVSDGRAGLCVRKGGRSYVDFADGGICYANEVC